MKFQSLLLILFGVFAPVIAAAEYWISVASFKNRDSAELALVNAQVKSEQAFAVYGARTDKGFFFRVMAGPYLTISEAKRAQQTLSSNGRVWPCHDAKKIAFIRSRTVYDESLFTLYLCVDQSRLGTVPILEAGDGDPILGCRDDRRKDTKQEQ